MDPRNLPKGQAQDENQGDGRTVNMPGVYYHEKADKFIETTNYPVAGKLQADAFVQVGYRKATDEEVSKFRKLQEEGAKARAEAKAKAESTATTK